MCVHTHIHMYVIYVCVCVWVGGWVGGYTASPRAQTPLQNIHTIYLSLFMTHPLSPDPAIAALVPEISPSLLHTPVLSGRL